MSGEGVISVSKEWGAVKVDGAATLLSLPLLTLSVNVHHTLHPCSMTSVLVYIYIYLCVRNRGVNWMKGSHI